ncbi:MULTISPECIES: SDR family NAD(P)-dependent oxidoreductase [unclassified Mesorhizobium]|uniref:SDR family NAD(P)-dependent oxidoreductase n=1 Tax=unclassified Mesorhizobium TaxID=325217 RepID=UPI0033372E6A
MAISADTAQSSTSAASRSETSLTRAVLPGLLSRNRGAIVNIASVLAFDTSFGGIYSGTKAYVVNFTEALQREVAGTKLAVQVVLPGATRTEFWEAAGSDIADVPAEIVMTADDLVGLAKGETVTAPGLSDPAGLETYLGARQGFFGSLLAGKPAARYAA